MATRDIENLLVSLGLDHGRIHLINGGWSYWTFEVEQDDHYEQVESAEPGWIFRFPRNSDVEENLLKERSVLSVVAPRIDFAVPRFEHAGYWNGQPYVGYRKIPGRPLSGAPFAGSNPADEAAGSIASILS